MNFQESLKQVALSIQNSEQKKALVVEKIRKECSGILEGNEFLENKILQKVKPAVLNEKIAGIDSGIALQELFNIDLFLLRAVGVVFNYENGVLKKTEYFPQVFDFPQPSLSFNALEREELMSDYSIKRVSKEMQIAIEVIEKFSPKYCFIDGSLLPQHLDKPKTSSKIRKNFDLMLEKVQELYETAVKKKCELIGCVEDSRGNRWSEILENAFKIQLQEYHDAVLLNELLSKGERSFVFSYAKNAQEHPMLNDFKKEWQNSIFAFYIKPSSFDFPLRVEFLNPESNVLERVEKIASIVLAQSSMHKEYAFPAVLIEADLRARLKPEEIEIVRNKIIDKIGKNAFVLKRRNKRPF